MATKTLYVGNLPYNSTEADVFAHFSAYGASNVRIVEGRGFGFVDIDADKVERAIEEKHESEMGGRRLTVNEARPRAPRSDGGGFRPNAPQGGRPSQDFGGSDRDWGGGGGDGRDRGRERGGRDARDRGNRRGF